MDDTIIAIFGLIVALLLAAHFINNPISGGAFGRVYAHIKTNPAAVFWWCYLVLITALCFLAWLLEWTVRGGS